jgi:starch synthase
MVKGASETAVRVTTVSPTYALEIRDPWYSYGLYNELNLRHWKLCGIKNGIDLESYNPETDYQLYCNYSKDDMSGKGVCKQKLQERLCLEQRWDVPIVAMVTRLVEHKGLDLVRMGLEELMNTENMQFIILGSGDEEYEQFFRDMQWKYPGRLCFCHGFVPELARKIYSGADIFLMPSKMEPCGLSQMIALRYGTIPVVRETGGLKDSVFDSADGYGNGFTFANYYTADLQGAVRRALWGIQDNEGWHKLMWRAMMSDNSWDRSAQDYINVYNDTLNWL